VNAFLPIYIKEAHALARTQHFPDGLQLCSRAGCWRGIAVFDQGSAELLRDDELFHCHALAAQLIDLPAQHRQNKRQAVLQRLCIRRLCQHFQYLVLDFGDPQGCISPAQFNPAHLE